jgi:hypothetical protein
MTETPPSRGSTIRPTTGTVPACEAARIEVVGLDGAIRSLSYDQDATDQGARPALGGIPDACH